MLSVGERECGSNVAPQFRDLMCLASVTKAYTGAVVLRLVDQEGIAPDDKVGEQLPSMPLAWHSVTIRQLLNHPSGIPDYTKSMGFSDQFNTAPTARVSPTTIIDWVRADPLNFPSGTTYEYSNTDNIIAALIAEKTSGRTYPNLPKAIVFRPLKLNRTSLPAGVELPKPFLHGYVASPPDAGSNKNTQYEDVSTILSPTGAWAAVGIESTPEDLGTFIRALLAKRFFSTRVQKQQFKWVKAGESSPAGPGKNSAGLSPLRYKRRCGTVYGHTGNFPGYVQLAAADETGKRSVTTSLSIPAPTGALHDELREMQTLAVCRVMGK